MAPAVGSERSNPMMGSEGHPVQLKLYLYVYKKKKGERETCQDRTNVFKLMQLTMEM